MLPGSDDTYSVEVDRDGFESFDTSGVTVAPGETARIDVTLVGLVNADAIEVTPNNAFRHFPTAKTQLSAPYTPHSMDYNGSPERLRAEDSVQVDAGSRWR
ncbi:MAG: carboxypeptidase-like regulatory domain-containing protein [Halobacteriales archaeon]|nr:carboxypeptidase-like regulatory domain-containing protein [Halobacteriales archaeon]